MPDTQQKNNESMHDEPWGKIRALVGNRIPLPHFPYSRKGLPIGSPVIGGNDAIGKGGFDPSEITD